MRLHILGGLDLTNEVGEPVEAVTRQARLMLGCLALAGSKGLTRAELCSLFWPDRPAAQARNSLRQSLAAIRKILSGDGVADVISLHADLEVVRLPINAKAIDVHSFESGFATQDPLRWAMAAEAYRGDVFLGVQCPADIEEWVAAPRRHYQRRALELAERLSKVEKADDQVLDAARSLAERLLASTSAAEEAHRSLMRVHLHQGRTSAALRQFKHCEEALRSELQAAPDAETMQVLALIRASAGGEVRDARTDSVAGTQARKGESASRPSVAVMAFENLGGEADEYFADGVVEEITSALSRIRDFFVIARQSAFTYKGRFVDVHQIGRELGVTYVIEGTVRRGGDRLRISVQLIDANSRAQLWSDRYEGAATEIFEFQDRIAAQVAGAMHPAIRRAEIDAAIRKPRSNLGAYDLVMRAYPKVWGQNAVAINEAMPLLKEAISVDKTYGRAHALLAWCHALNSTYLWSAQPAREVDEATRIVGHAIGLVQEDPTAMTALGAAMSLCGDTEGATALIEGALSLDPNNAWAWTRLGWNCVYRGQAEDALAHFEKAMRLSPVDPFAFNMKMGRAAALARTDRLKDSIAIAKEVIKKHPDVTWSYRQLAAWSAMDGDIKTARWAAERMLAAQPDFTINRYLEVPAFRGIPEYRNWMADALRKAGLPEF